MLYDVESLNDNSAYLGSRTFGYCAFEPLLCEAGFEHLEYQFLY
jgi:hypothetical protein